MEFSRVEPSYTSQGGCRIVWTGADEDDEYAVILSKRELDSLIEILRKDATGTVTLEDQSSSILVNSDVTQFGMAGRRMLEMRTGTLQRRVLEYAKIPHDPQYVRFSTKEFYPSVSVRRDEDEKPRAGSAPKSLLQAILAQEPASSGAASEPGLFRVMSTRRSTRKFARTRVEDWMVDKIMAAADTAPTAGNFQGFQIFYVKSKKAKQALVEAANNQPYVDAPVVLVFCMEPQRVQMKFPPEILEKFSLQDATLAAAYSQLAATSLGLSSIWIGMIDEAKVMSILGTHLRPSSILCIGYPAKRRPPKTRRKLKELIRVIE